MAHAHSTGSRKRPSSRAMDIWDNASARPKRRRVDSLLYSDFRLCEKMPDGTSKYLSGDSFAGYGLPASRANSWLGQYRHQLPQLPSYRVDYEKMLVFLNASARGRHILTKEPFLGHYNSGQPEQSSGLSGPPDVVLSVSDLRVTVLYFCRQRGRD